MQTHFFPGHPSASHPPLAALAGPAQRLGAFSQPKHLYPCPSRGSWLPSLANRPCRESCRKGTVPRGLSRKRSPGSLPPCTRSFRRDGLRSRGGWGGYAGRRGGWGGYSGRSCCLPTRPAQAPRSHPDVMPTGNLTPDGCPLLPPPGSSCRLRGEVAPLGKGPGGVLFSGC